MFSTKCCYQTQNEDLFSANVYHISPPGITAVSLNIILLIFRLDDECVIKQMKISIDQS